MMQRLSRGTAAETYWRGTSRRARATTNESFVLGGRANDFQNFVNGSNAGTLIAGREYPLSYHALIRSNGGKPPGPGTASGAISLVFVPEPTRILLWTALVLSPWAVRRGLG